MRCPQPPQKANADATCLPQLGQAMVSTAGGENGDAWGACIGEVMGEDMGVGGTTACGTCAGTMAAGTAVLGLGVAVAGAIPSGLCRAGTCMGAEPMPI